MSELNKISAHPDFVGEHYLLTFFRVYDILYLLIFNRQKIKNQKKGFRSLLYCGNNDICILKLKKY